MNVSKAKGECLKTHRAKELIWNECLAKISMAGFFSLHLRNMPYHAIINQGGMVLCGSPKGSQTLRAPPKAALRATPGARASTTVGWS